MNLKSSTPFPASITYGAVLGQVIARRRQASGGIHQQAMAEALGIGQSAYSKLESGQSAMTVAQLRGVAARLMVVPGDLLAETDGYL